MTARVRGSVRIKKALGWGFARGFDGSGVGATFIASEKDFLFSRHPERSRRILVVVLAVTNYASRVKKTKHNGNKNFINSASLRRKSNTSTKILRLRYRSAQNDG